MIPNKIINNILGTKPKFDCKSSNYNPNLSLRDEICDNCGRSVYERELIFEEGKEKCRYCVND